LEKTKIFDINKALQRGVSNLHLPLLDLLPSSIRFIDIQDRIGEISNKTHNTINPQEVLKSAVFEVMKKYDYVLIDCPPNLGYITRNGIEISDYYLIPTIPDTLSTYGIPQIIGAIHELSTARNLPIRCLGLVVTKFDSRSSSHARGKLNLPARFARKFTELNLSVPPIFQTIMPQANATSEAMEFANAANSFKAKYGRSKSGDRYLYEYVLDLTREFMRHVGN
jgi:chromosome partitioning protein